MTTTPYPLGRVVLHDERSKLYSFSAPAPVALSSIKHRREIPVLDQGNLGSCTGNASVGALGTDPLFQTISGIELNEDYAVKVYSLATQLDEYPGEYPPDDEGSSGLGAAKALLKLGLISGYQHAFDLPTMQQALMSTPVIIGISFYNNFFTPDANGNLSIGKNDYVAGGHELCVDELDLEGQRFGVTNSWGTSWGIDGRCFISFDLMKKLLAKDGDVTIFVPVTQAPPTPNPPPTPVDLDLDFWNSIKVWAKAKHTAKDNKAASAAAVKWAAAKNYPA